MRGGLRCGRRGAHASRFESVECPRIGADLLPGSIAPVSSGSAGDADRDHPLPSWQEAAARRVAGRVIYAYDPVAAGSAEGARICIIGILAASAASQSWAALTRSSTVKMPWAARTSYGSQSMASRRATQSTTERTRGDLRVVGVAVGHEIQVETLVD